MPLNGGKVIFHSSAARHGCRSLDKAAQHSGLNGSGQAARESVSMYMLEMRVLDYRLSIGNQRYLGVLFDVRPTSMHHTHRSSSTSRDVPKCATTAAASLLHCAMVRCVAGDTCFCSTREGENPRDWILNEMACVDQKNKRVSGQHARTGLKHICHTLAVGRMAYSRVPPVLQRAGETRLPAAVPDVENLRTQMK